MNKSIECSVCATEFTPAKPWHHRCEDCNKSYYGSHWADHLSYEDGKELDHIYGLDGYPNG